MADDTPPWETRLGSQPSDAPPWESRLGDKKYPQISSIDASLPTEKSMFTGDAAMLRNIGEEKPGYNYADFPLIPVKKNVATGEHSLAVPEPFRSMARGTADLISQAQNKGEKPTPDALMAQVGMMGGFKPAAKIVTKGAETAGGKVLDMAGKAREMVNTKSDSMAKKIPDYPQLSGDEIKALSTDSYTMAAKHGGVLKPEMSDKFLASLNDLVPKGEISKALSEDRPFMQMMEKLQIAKGKPITLEDAQGIDELLGDTADSHFKVGGMTKEGKKILDIQQKFRDMISNAGEGDIVGGKAGFHAWKDAQFYWAQQAKMHDLEKIVTRANLTDNPVTAMKTGFRNLYLNKKALRGYSDEQKKAIENAAKTGIPAEVLRIVGSRLIPIANIAHGNLGGAATAQAANMAARAAGTKMQLNRANKVAKSISNEVQKRRLQSQNNSNIPPINTGTPIENVAQQLQPKEGL